MRTAKMRNKIKGDWNEKNIVKDQSLKRMISLNSIGNLGYWIA